MAPLIDDDPRIIEFDVRTDEMLVNMGPQHPSTHGVLRLVLRTDGEIVSEVEPHIGYLHRCAEKIGENLTARQWIPYTDRMDYLAAMNMNLGWSLAVEKLMQYQVSERARHLRVLIAEMGRIASHLVGMGAYGLDLGTFSPFLYAFRERENWVQARKYRGRDIPTMDPATFDPPNEVTPERIVSAVETLDMKVSALVAAMQTSVRFSASDITRVIDGIQKGLPWNAIAESVGRSPGAFDYYVAKAREAA